MNDNETREWKSRLVILEGFVLRQALSARMLATGATTAEAAQHLGEELMQELESLKQRIQDDGAKGDWDTYGPAIDRAYREVRTSLNSLANQAAKS